MAEPAVVPTEARGESAPSPTVGVVVVSYQSATQLADCLKVLASPAVEVVVADNASTDGSPLIVKEAGVTVVEIGTNAGYPYACNRGVEALTKRHEWLAFVNPDVRLSGADLVRAATEVPAHVDLFSPLMLDSNGRPQRDLARPGPSWSRTARMYLLSRAAELSARRHYRRLLESRDRFVETEVTSGGSLVIRRSKFEEVGGWSENFFLDMDDVDLCCRVRQSGGKVVVDRGIRGVHYKFTSSTDSRSDLRSLEAARSQVIYFTVNRPRWEAYVVAGAVVAGTAMRLIARATVTGRLAAVREAIRLVIQLATMSRDVLRLSGELGSTPPRAAFR